MITDVLEALVRYARSGLTKEAQSMDDKTIAISCSGLFREWTPGSYKAGDVRTDGETPYECISDHDSAANPGWDLSVRSLWKPYHSRKKEWALPFIQPTGAHDIYKEGEYMVWTDGNTYQAVQDTGHSPKDYPTAWKTVE